MTYAKVNIKTINSSQDNKFRMKLMTLSLLVLFTLLVNFFLAFNIQDFYIADNSFLNEVILPTFQQYIAQLY